MPSSNWTRRSTEVVVVVFENFSFPGHFPLGTKKECKSFQLFLSLDHRPKHEREPVFTLYHCFVLKTFGIINSKYVFTYFVRGLWLSFMYAKQKKFWLNSEKATWQKNLQHRQKLNQFIIDGSSPDPGSLDPSRSVKMRCTTRFRPKKLCGRVLHFQKCNWKT